MQRKKRGWRLYHWYSKDKSKACTSYDSFGLKAFRLHARRSSGKIKLSNRHLEVDMEIEGRACDLMIFDHKRKVWRK